MFERVILNQNYVFDQVSHPRAKAPDHWRRNPRRADTRMAVELLKFQLKDNTPGGSNHGLRANKKKIVTGVVFHINLYNHTKFSD